MADKCECKSVSDVPIIVRREIEARMIAPFIRAFAEEFGDTHAYSLDASSST